MDSKYPKVAGLIGPHDLTHEQYREYVFFAPADVPDKLMPEPVVCRIVDPVALYIGKTTHRIVDADGVVHCVPAIGRLGCTLSWKNWNPHVPVNF